jgi:hypothetical protein
MTNLDFGGKTEINNRPKHNIYVERNDRNKNVGMKEVIEKNNGINTDHCYYFSCCSYLI